MQSGEHGLLRPRCRCNQTKCKNRVSSGNLSFSILKKFMFISLYLIFQASGNAEPAGSGENVAINPDEEVHFHNEVQSSEAQMQVGR